MIIFNLSSGAFVQVSVFELVGRVVSVVVSGSGFCPVSEKKPS